MTADFEELAHGYGLVEGPTVTANGHLVFSDVLGGGVYQLAPDGSVATVVPKRRGVGGIALHADGGVVVSGRDIVHVKDGETRTLLHVDGAAGWNDLCTDAAGRVYAGLLRFAVFDPNAEPVPGECWRIDAEGSGVAVTFGVVHPNGVALSPDERTLYHSDTRAGVVVVHDLDDDGKASNLRHFAADGEGRPDGLAVDQEGFVWVAMVGGGRVVRFAPDGHVERSIEVPAKVVTSVCFAGDDLLDLIVVSADNARDPDRAGSIFRTRVDVAGAPVRPARI